MDNEASMDRRGRTTRLLASIFSGAFFGFGLCDALMVFGYRIPFDVRLSMCSAYASGFAIVGVFYFRLIEGMLRKYRRRTVFYVDTWLTFSLLIALAILFIPMTSSSHGGAPFFGISLLLSAVSAIFRLKSLGKGWCSESLPTDEPTESSN